MGDRQVWVVNKSANDFERTDIDLKKHIILKPFIPQPFPISIAMKYAKFNGISIVADIEKYFNEKKMNQLIIRDAGIGDLLLLEPILRQLTINGKRDVSILSRFPEVFENNPHISKVLKMTDRETIPTDIKFSDYDCYEDLRFWSETCQDRDKKHRTDCYNQKFNINIEDIEPRIYFQRGEKSIIKREENKRYIGLACDGSHSYRRYENGAGLIRNILDQNKNNVVIVFGTWPMVRCPRDARVIDLQEKTTVREAINIVRDLDALVSVDSGMMHVALSMHVPTVCIFSIINPDLRLHYYKGPKEVIYKKELSCIGCGNFHMAICKHGDKAKDAAFVAPCLRIEPQEIYDRIMKLPAAKQERVFYADEKPVAAAPAAPAVIHLGDKKLTMPIIVLNEEKNLPRFIELVMKHPSIGRVIAIDGGSTDRTVAMLRAAGAFVYIHQYDLTYHDMQAMQRNYSFSFVRDGEKCLVMDIDECFSKELSDYLPALAESNFEHGIISRRTFKFYADITDRRKQIKHYPDYQPRFYWWNRKMKWVGSPHHAVHNVANPVKIDKDIIHFEEEGKDRKALEARWAKMQKATKEVYA